MKLIWNKGLFIKTSLLRYIPFIAFQPIGITLGPIVLVDKDCLSRNLINHEAVHVRQYIETLFIGFLVLYLLFWLRGIISGYDSYESYKRIPFEIEASDYSSKFEERKWFGWIKYIKQPS